mmetsp:Transcript_48991/g.77415  ORF Transcript_48991/g.77415 Transcript_48991/m.77415 type:complete len:218 (-) Transcript_48991:74-727(-)
MSSIWKACQTSTASRKTEYSRASRIQQIVWLRQSMRLMKCARLRRVSQETLNPKLVFLFANLVAIIAGDVKLMHRDVRLRRPQRVGIAITTSSMLECVDALEELALVRKQNVLGAEAKSRTEISAMASVSSLQSRWRCRIATTDWKTSRKLLHGSLGGSIIDFASMATLRQESMPLVRALEQDILLAIIRGGTPTIATPFISSTSTTTNGCIMLSLF